jgi:hypothetical protein
MADPTGALARVDTDAKEAFAAKRAKNLAQTVLEYKERTQFAGQALHVEFAEAPTAAEYVPVPQSVQAADPIDALYLPATHAAHKILNLPTICFRFCVVG